MRKDIEVCILDYGSGNVRSVYNMVSTIASRVFVSNEKNQIVRASHIILPGVGSFGAAMKKIKDKVPLDILETEVLKNKKPFLGICVGMQILTEKGYEFGVHEGLGWIPGETTKLDSKNFTLPHVGWNTINIVNPSSFLKQFTDSQDFYFVHSYIAKLKKSENILAQTQYGSIFPSIINRDNIFGVQFHPEKSQKAGRILIENFLNLL